MLDYHERDRKKAEKAVGRLVGSKKELWLVDRKNSEINRRYISKSIIVTIKEVTVVRSQDGSKMHDGFTFKMVSEDDDGNKYYCNYGYVETRSYPTEWWYNKPSGFDDEKEMLLDAYQQHNKMLREVWDPIYSSAEKWHIMSLQERGLVRICRKHGLAIPKYSTAKSCPQCQKSSISVAKEDWYY